MKDLDQILKEDYSKKMNSLKFSNRAKLYKLYDKPEHTPVLKKIVVMNVTLACFILICGVTVTATATPTLKELIYEKTRDSAIVDEERDKMTSRLENWNYKTSSDNYSDKNGHLHVEGNECSETIGTFELGVDMIGVASKTEDGEFITGYCYSDELMEVNGSYSHLNSNDNQYHKNGQERNWIYVYDSDGINVLGKLVEGEFKTNEQLKDSDSNIIVIDGDDIDEYEAKCQSRISQRLGNESENGELSENNGN